jgi:hypothetical protein
MVAAFRANLILRRLVLAVILCCVPCSGRSVESAPTFRWAASLQGSSGSYVEVLDLAIDQAGNTVMVGNFHNEGTSLAIGGITFTNHSFFLAKWNRTGNVLWAKTDGYEYTRWPAIALDDDGNTYVLCNPSVLGPEKVVSLAGTNISGTLALLKYDSNGKGLWARALSTSEPYILPFGITADSAGNTYSVVSFDQPVTIGETNLAGAIFDGALLKCDPDGQVLWVRTATGSSFWSMRAAAVDPSGNVYATGSFETAISFGATNLVSRGSSDLFLAKYSSNGELLWVRQSGGENHESSNRLAVDGAGNCLTEARFFQTASFGRIVLSNTVAKDYYAVVKYGPAGNVLWANQSSATADSWADLTVDGDGNCYFAGQTDSANLVVVKHNSAGNLVWTKVGAEAAPAVVRADSLGHCYIACRRPAQTVTFDAFTLTSTNSYDHIILAKLDTTTAPQLSAQLAGDSVRLSWSVLAEDYHLESNPDFTSSTLWTSNTASLVVTGLLNTVTLPRSAQNSFYRLKRP